MLTDNFATKQPYYWGLMNTVRVQIIHYICRMTETEVRFTKENVFLLNKWNLQIFSVVKDCTKRQVNQENIAMEMTVIHR